MKIDNKVLTNKLLILYGLGISNNAIKKYFDKENIKYIVVNDNLYDESIIRSNQKSILVIKSPGISNDTKWMLYFKSIKANIITDIELFYLLRKDILLIAISGTLGKTSTVLLTYELLKDKLSINICGNIGIPIFEYIDKEYDYLIVECSSYQLEYIKTFKPYIYCLLNISSHHLAHHKSFEDYLKSKLNPINNMDMNTCFITSSKLDIKYNSKAKIIYYDLNVLDDKIKNNTINSHDLSNISASITVYEEIMKTKDGIMDKVLSFSKPKFREQIVYKDDGITIVNDSKSTSILSTIEAVNDFSSYDQIHLIMGGVKVTKEELKPLITPFKEMVYKTKPIIHLYGENRFMMLEYLFSDLLDSIDEGVSLHDTLYNNKDKLIDIYLYNDLKEVISSMIYHKPCTIIFSPGAQSFDQYHSFIERGNDFNRLLKDNNFGIIIED